MSRRRKNNITLPVLGDTGAARLDYDRDRNGQILAIRIPDGKRFTLRPTDQHSALGGALQAMPCPVDEYRARNLLQSDQHSAAITYRETHRRAFGSSVKAIDLEACGARNHGADGYRITNRQAEAQRAYARAVAVLKPLERKMIDYVVLDERYSKHAAVLLGIAPRRGMAILRTALDRLAKFYGYRS